MGLADIGRLTQNPGLNGMAAPPAGMIAVSNGAGGEVFVPDPAAQQPIPPGAGTYVPPTTPAAPQSPDMSQGMQDANAIIQQQLNAWGLGGLSSWAWQEISQGATANQVTNDLYSTKEFQQQFRVIFDRQAKGLTPITPNDVLNYRKTASELAQAAGLPSGFMNSSLADEMLGNDVSTSELQSRVDAAKTAIYNADPNQQAVFQQLYSAGVTPGALAAHFLDPTLALPILQNQLQAAQLGGISLDEGLGAIGSKTGLSQAELERLAAAGVSNSQGASILGKLSHEQSLATPLVGESAQTVGVDQAAQAEAGLNQNAADQLAREAQQRVDEFNSSGSGSSDVTNSGLLQFQRQ